MTFPMQNNLNNKYSEVSLSDLKLSAENEQAFRQAVVDAIPGTFYLLDAHVRLVGWNAYLRDEIIGKPENEMASTNALEFIHPDDRHIIRRKMLNVLNHGVEESAEVRVFLRGGAEIRWRMMTGKRIMLDGNPFLIGMGIDITERKQAEQLLRENEERFRKLFESPSGIKILLEPDTGNIIDANQTAADFYGWTIDELKKMRIQQINTLPAEVVKSSLEKSRTSEQNQFSFRHRKADGSIRDVEVFVNTIKITGKVLLYAIIQDITQRKRFETLSALRLRMIDMANICPVEELMQTTLDEAEKLTDSSIGFVHFIEKDQPSSLQIWSTNTIKEMCQSEQKEWHYPLNDKGVWAEALQEQRAAIQNDYTILPVGHPEITRELVVPVIRANSVMAILGVGNKPCPYTEEDSWFLSALFDIAWDIVARKRAEQSEQEMQAALTQSQKMELVGQLAGGIAHDFNNMLEVILGNIEMAMDQDDLEKSLQNNLKYILKAVNRSADLTRQLLAFARKQTVMPIVLELNTMVESMLAVLRRVIGENITIVWVPDSHRTMVKVDPSQIDQILVNLCINARDAIGSIGKITIETGRLCQNKAQSTPHSPCKVPGDYVTLSVTDTGCGIEKEHLPHIFEPFFTTKKQGKGRGLGLSTVYGIVKQNNGCIDFRSKPGKGTTFNIHLPRHKGGYSDPDESVEPAPSSQHGKETILLVENEPDILNLCKLTLEKSGYSVLTASKPHDAIELAEQHKGTIKLLLTDVVLPEMNGCDLAKKLHSISPKLKTLFMSGYSTDVITCDEVLDEGANFIQKPFSLKSLIMAVEKTLDSDKP